MDVSASGRYMRGRARQEPGLYGYTVLWCGQAAGDHGGIAPTQA